MSGLLTFVGYIVLSIVTAIRYVLSVIATILLTLIAVLFSPLIALAVDASGDLPVWLKWFQPSDNPAWGDEPWAAEHPGWSRYRLAVGYLIRNPAQGFDQFAAACVTFDTPFNVYGNLNIKDGDAGVAGWYLITADGFFHFAYIVNIGFGKCMTGGFGWRLNSLAKRYQHKTLGQVVFTPLRFYRFNKG